MIKKILLIAILVFALLGMGCVRKANKELRLYFFGDGSIDKTFAIKLKKCQRYTTPVKYIKTCLRAVLEFIIYKPSCSDSK